MKKAWSAPLLQTEVFEANEYIAACYTGVCDISGEVFLDSNGNGVYDRGIDSRKYYNEACGQQYSITGQDSVMPAKNAFVVDWFGNATPVWNFDDYHVTTTLSRTSGRTTRDAPGERHSGSIFTAPRRQSGRAHHRQF